MFEEFYTVLIFAGIISVVATIVACTIIITRYKKKLKAPIYPVDKYAALSLAGARDDFLGSTVTRVRVASRRDK